MNLLTKKESRGLWAIWAILLLPILVSCHTEYTTQHFSFPPGSKPHENDWKYTALIIVSSNESPITKKSKKNVQIKVYDKNKTYFLKDEFEFVSASIDANVVWDNFEEIKIELVEVGNEFAEDDYNNQLVKSGPNVLLSLIYQYNHEDNIFVKIQLNHGE